MQLYPIQSDTNPFNLARSQVKDTYFKSTVNTRGNVIIQYQNRNLHHWRSNKRIVIAIGTCIS